MIVYRVGRSKFSKDFAGEGARLHGGRWNHILTPCIYTSESRALALLEYTVNVTIDAIPRSLSITTFEISDASVQELSIEELPGNWTDSPAPASTKDFGTNLLKVAATSVIKIPSAVIPQEFNFILNPKHVGAKDFKILQVEDFVYDVRIKLI
ncbi:MAG: RES family NAD+ phosphorylase [Saprospiraceae bacterium]